MKGAILEVLLVNAEGIGETNFIGSPGYHVIVECGSTQWCRSKTSPGYGDKVYWNEKFVFELPFPELEKLSHLKLRIVNEDYLTDGEFVGETMIFLKGIIVEGNYKGLVELSPGPYNVVLEDDTYKGQITIGLKFISNVVLPKKRRQEHVQQERNLDKSICRTIVSFWRKQWWRIFFSYGNRNSRDKHKQY